MEGGRDRTVENVFNRATPTRHQNYKAGPGPVGFVSLPRPDVRPSRPAKRETNLAQQCVESAQLGDRARVAPGFHAPGGVTSVSNLNAMTSSQALS